MKSVPSTYPRVLVVVITYNGSHWIRDCLGSLQRSTVPLDVLVVDNQSTDDTIAIIRQQFPEVQLIESDENLGFGRGNNVGMQKAWAEDYDYAFLLNQDAWIDPNAVEILTKIHRQHPQYGIISPLHLSRAKTHLDRNFANYLGQSGNTELLSDALAPGGVLQEVYTVGFVNAAAWLISRPCLQRVGGFDPLFPHYGEDQDYVQRLTYHGFAVGFVPRAKIVHDREGYVKQSEKRRTLPIQYNGNLILLKNINRSFLTNLLIVLKNEAYRTGVALSSGDIAQLGVKIRLFYKIFSQLTTIRRHRKYCAEYPAIFLAKRT